MVLPISSLLPPPAQSEIGIILTSLFFISLLFFLYSLISSIYPMSNLKIDFIVDLKLFIIFYSVILILISSLTQELFQKRFFFPLFFGS